MMISIREQHGAYTPNFRPAAPIVLCANRLAISDHQRGEDIVVRPIDVVPEGEVRVRRADLFDLIAADEGDAIDAVGREGAQRPVEDAPAADFGEALGRVGGRVFVYGSR